MYLTSCAPKMPVNELLALFGNQLGYFITPAHGKRTKRLAEMPVWAADNGCYTAAESFSMDRYLTWLATHADHKERCLFATAPDVVGDARATLARSLPTMPQIRALGYPVALVGQDGLERLSVPWDEFDAYFVGGTTEWKLSAASFALLREAKERGKHVHMGRVNTRKRFLAAARAGCDSADGTMYAWGPFDLSTKHLLDWMAEARNQLALPLT